RDAGLMLLLQKLSSLLIAAASKGRRPHQHHTPYEVRKSLHISGGDLRGRRVSEQVNLFGAELLLKLAQIRDVGLKRHAVQGNRRTQAPPPVITDHPKVLGQRRHGRDQVPVVAPGTSMEHDQRFVFPFLSHIEASCAVRTTEKPLVPAGIHDATSSKGVPDHSSQASTRLNSSHVKIS